MNVRELIVELSKLPNQEQLILVDGYETGYDDITKVKEIDVEKHYDPAGCDGVWTYAGYSAKADTEIVKAYLLPR